MLIRSNYPHLRLFLLCAVALMAIGVSVPAVADECTEIDKQIENIYKKIDAEKERLKPLKEKEKKLDEKREALNAEMEKCLNVKPTSGDTSFKRCVHRVELKIKNLIDTEYVPLWDKMYPIEMAIDMYYEEILELKTERDSCGTDDYSEDYESEVDSSAEMISDY